MKSRQTASPFYMNKIIICDIDNTLANTNCEIQRKGHRTDIYPSPLTMDVLLDPEIYFMAKPIHPVISMVKKYYINGYDIVYLTARFPLFKGVTECWLEDYGLPAGHVVVTEGKPKGEYLQEMLNSIDTYNLEIVIFEDAPHEISSYLSVMSGVQLYIPDWPYNQHIRFGKRIRLTPLMYGV